MAATKKAQGFGSLFREAGRKAKLEAEQALEPKFTTFGDDGLTVIKKPATARIFNIIDYIESPWGLNMNTLFPVQRFIIKLYYDIPLDDTVKSIELSDMLNTKVEHRFTEKEYLRYLYSEGRCNIGEQDHTRRQLILPCGRRAGKCVEVGTLVTTDKGIFPIEQLGSAPVDESTSLDVGVAQESFRKARSSHFYNGGVKPVYRLKTDCGYSLSGTGNHRIKVISAVTGKVEWRYLTDLKEGDFAAINRSTDLWPGTYLDVTPYHNNDGRKHVDLPSTLDEKLGNLLGYLVGDGSWNNESAVSMTVENAETWEHADKLLTDLFGETRRQLDKRTNATGRIEFVGVKARRFLHELGWNDDSTRYNKSIPWSILRSPKTVVAAFLRGVFETDGCAEREGSSLTFSSASFRLAHELQVLLLNMGILCSVRKKWVEVTQRHYALLRIIGVRSRQKFIELIGFDSHKKNDPTTLATSKATEGKSDTDSIPYQLGPSRALLESVPKRTTSSYVKHQGPGRLPLRTALGNVHKPGSGEDLTYTKMAKSIAQAKECGAGAEEVAHFETLQEQDYFFDKVVSIEQAEAQVYDLTVPDGESFVANGFTNHNTTLSGIFASYEMYRLLNLHHPQSYYGLPPGNRIQIISVATDKDQAGLLFKEVSSHIARCDYFQPFVASSTLSDYLFRTPYDIEKFGVVQRYDNGKFQSLNGKASLRITFKSCVAKGLRGAGNIMVILDEMAHFIDAGQSSAEDIYSAIEPSTAAFSPKDPENPIKPIGDVEARIICISSPLNKQGKFFELFQQAMSGGDKAHNLLAIQAPTWEINPTVPAVYYKQKYAANPRVFMTEHGAQFSDRVRGWIEREQDLIDCIDPNLRPIEVGFPRMPHQMGIDVGLVGDGTSFVITYTDGDQIVLAYHELWEAGKDWRESNPHLTTYSCPYAREIANVERLDFDAISDWIYQLTKRFYITAGLFDRWNGLPLEQALHKRGLTMFNSQFFTRDETSKMYQVAKVLMLDKKLRLYNYPLPKTNTEKHSPLISELLSLQAEQMSKNVIIVEAPKQQGLHDDLTDGLVRAIYLSQEKISNTKITAPNPRGGMPSPMGAGQYQMMRARNHAGFSERTVPKSIGLRLGRRR